MGQKSNQKVLLKYPNSCAPLRTQTVDASYKAKTDYSDKPPPFVGTSDLANNLEVKPASVTEMLRKLSKKGFVDYTKSQGVILTISGKLLALKRLRAQLLWEYFLVEELKFDTVGARSTALGFASIKDDYFLERLSLFLGSPLYGLNGETIPTADGKTDHEYGVLLSSVKSGFMGMVSAIKESDAAFLQYLKKRKVQLGTRIKVLDICLFDYSIDIEILKTSNIFTISKKVADAILVSLSVGDL